MRYPNASDKPSTRLRSGAVVLALMSLPMSCLSAQRAAEPVAAKDTAGAGFHFAFGLGYVGWGADSRLGGAIPTVDVAAGYEFGRGIGLEVRLTATDLELPVLDNSLGVYYAPSYRGRRIPVGPAISVGLPLRIGGGQYYRDVEDYAAVSYGFGLRGAVPLGKRRRTRLFAESGVLTVRERFTEQRGWIDDGGIRWSMRHSGFRLRFGLAF